MAKLRELIRKLIEDARGLGVPYGLEDDRAPEPPRRNGREDLPA